MDEKEILDFVKSFNETVKSNAMANDLEMEESFTEVMSDSLTDFGEFDLWNPSSWLDKNIGAKVDGWHLEDDSETMNLIISIWKNWNGENIEGARITNSDVEKNLKRIRKFINNSLSGSLPGNRIDQGHPAGDLAELIFELKNDEIINKFRIILITDGIVPVRKGENYVEDGIEIDISIWDMRRLFNAQEKGERKGIIIDFNEYGGPISFVSEKAQNGFYTSYLAFVPGSLLADLYERHKTRLLEMNVRVFLSERPKVNKGIRDTILNEPSMMGAYNNGLTIYAEELETEELENGQQGISIIKDFQIVNGGQTTASLFHTRRKHKSELEDIFVQMKVMVVHESAKPSHIEASTRLSDILVPKIGKYSNTQNAIKPSDLSSNETPHPEIHNISLNNPAPDITGGTRISYWYYEKSRGSWDEKRRIEAKTASQKKRWDLQYPRNQKFSKGDFAKVWYSYRGKPYLASRGPAKCFAEFNSNLLKEELKFSSSDPTYWIDYFYRTVALRIISMRIEKEVGAKVRQGVYMSYRQDIIAYTLAVFGEKTEGKYNLIQVWNDQEIPDVLFDWLMEISDIVHEHIIDIPTGRTHVKEWCKSMECWETMIRKCVFPRIPVEIKNKLDQKMIGAKPAPTSVDDARAFCISKKSQEWFDLHEFLKSRNLMSSKQQNQCRNMARILKKEPKLTGGKDGRKWLSMACKEIWEAAEKQYNWNME
jgi:hypothetical protein